MLDTEGDRGRPGERHRLRSDALRSRHDPCDGDRRPQDEQLARALSGRLDAILATGSNRVVVESNGPQHDIGEQCGGANPSSTQPYFFHVFHAAQLERSGELEASVMNC